VLASSDNSFGEFGGKVFVKKFTSICLGLDGFSVGELDATFGTELGAIAN
jgi:hypothetical protein